MAWNVQPDQVHPMSAKWQLAERLTGYSDNSKQSHHEKKLPEMALQSLFDTTIEQLEKKRCMTIPPEIKKRVWDNVSSKKLIMLKNIFISKFCTTILNSFDEMKAQKMLEEHLKTGAIETEKYLIPLHLSIEEHREPVRNFIYQKAYSLIPSWVPEIVAAVNKEIE